MKRYIIKVTIIVFLISPFMTYLLLTKSFEAQQKLFSRNASLKSHYLKNVKKFGKLEIGHRLPFGGPGDATSYPIKNIPKSNFYIYVHRMGIPTWCVFDECSFFDGSLVECMGGWLSGDNQPETAGEIGVDIEKVWKGKISIVILADKNAKIVGLYPQHTEGDVVAILAQYQQYRNDVIRCMKRGVILDQNYDVF